MYTFNLGFVFGQGRGVCTIVCNSANPIDKEAVQTVAMNTFKEAAGTGMNGEAVMKSIVRAIKDEVGVNAVLVNADVACMIPMN